MLENLSWELHSYTDVYSVASGFNFKFLRNCLHPLAAAASHAYYTLKSIKVTFIGSDMVASVTLLHMLNTCQEMKLNFIFEMVI